MRSGFTLVELVVVVLILAILAAVAAPRVFSYTDDTSAATLMRSMDAIIDAAEHHYATTGQWPSTTGSWNAPGDFDGYLANSVFTRSLRVGIPQKAQYCTPVWSNTATYKRVYFPWLTPDFADKCDAEFDDGNSSTGTLRVQYGTTGEGIPNAILFYYYDID